MLDGRGRTLLLGRLDGLFDRGWSGLLFDADNAGRQRAHKDDVAAVVARCRNDGLDGAFGGNTTAAELAEFEHCVFDLPLSRAANGAGITKNVLEMLLKACATFWIELHRFRTWITRIRVD